MTATADTKKKKRQLALLRMQSKTTRIVIPQSVLDGIGATSGCNIIMRLVDTEYHVIKFLVKVPKSREVTIPKSHANRLLLTADRYCFADISA